MFIAKIIDKSCGQIKAQFSISLTDDALSKEKVILEAWNKVKANGVVKDDTQENYKIEFAEEI
ncbi:hypothetical protein [Nitrosomonas supralitoralis]|uniref:Uncharacterized protein n=1 Tax=Nitrosomonas supralitoralis TaxID=2116706 RepID=A0A2P7NQX9_9PROT|nr:hypothetical protein [Nitrosomonas supralitoralis]PSJ15847.1 hypothetical protein C7H79_16795 [Nitrosomonas supralitoralis]